MDAKSLVQPVVSAEVILNNLKEKGQNETTNAGDKTELDTATPDIVSLKQKFRDIPRGIPKSGRTWKTKKESRYSSMRLDKTLKTSWNKKMKLRAEHKSVKGYEKELKQVKAKKQQDLRKRQEENKKRKEELQRKAEIVQTIKDTRKIKKMKKKQLRMIEKR